MDHALTFAGSHAHMNAFTCACERFAAERFTGRREDKKIIDFSFFFLSSRLPVQIRPLSEQAAQGQTKGGKSARKPK